MPTYDYQHVETSECGLGNTFEIFASISSEQLTHCPNCQKEVKRLIGKGAGFVLKGGGWYSDGYSNPKPAVGLPKTEHKAADPAKATETKTYKKEEK